MAHCRAGLFNTPPLWPPFASRGGDPVRPIFPSRCHEHARHRLSADQCSLADLCPALLRGGDQLHRPPGDWHPQANAAGAVPLRRAGLRCDRIHLSGGLRHRPAALRADHGSHRGPPRVRAGGGGLEHRRGDARGGRLAAVAADSDALHRPAGRRVSRWGDGGAGAIATRARAGRGGQLPRLDQGRGGVVSQEGAGPGDGHL